MKITALQTTHLAEYSDLVWFELETDQGLVGLDETFRSSRASDAQAMLTTP